MAAGPPQAKRARYFGPVADPEQPGTSSIRSSDTPILVEDEDESEDLFDPELYHSRPSSAKITGSESLPWLHLLPQHSKAAASGNCKGIS